jgi:1-acyl-sn-glycerol-3-phosphate acyltransferase
MKVLRSIFICLYFPYEWLVFFPVFLINTLFFGIVAVIVATIAGPRIGGYYGGVIWSRFNALVVPMFVKVIGKERIEPGKSYIVIANHQSFFDVFLIYGWLGIDIKWIMKKELFKIPGLGFGAKKVGHIFIDRSNKRASLRSMENAKKVLINGTSAVIFPEGTRSKSGEIGDFKRGAFKMAIDFGLPILPVTVINTRKILSANSLILLPGKTKMVIHQPIDINYYNESNMNDLLSLVRNTIDKGLKTYSTHAL